MNRQHIESAVRNAELENKNRADAYELTRQLAFYMIGLELALCGYMLLNANKIVSILGAPLLFLCSGVAALAGLVWRYAWNEDVYRQAHHMKATTYHLMMLKIMFPAYVVFVLLSLLTYSWAIGGGYYYLSTQRHAATAPEISTPESPSTPAKKGN
jgi:hypothetical protein